MHASPLRCLIVWAVATTLAGGLIAWLAPLAGSGPADPGFDDLLVRLCSVVAIVGTAGLWLATGATVLEALRGRPRSGRGIPAPVRRWVLAACGAGLVAGLSTAPALATPGEVHIDHGPVSVLAGLPLPDRAVGLPGGASMGTAPLGQARHAGRPPVSTVVVRAGDTLWDLASVHLGDPARWPEIYALNRAAIGADPSLIHPATRLRLPADRSEETP